MLKAIEIRTKDGLCDAWLATPATGGPWPGVIFCMDAVGPRANLWEMAERLASSGYAVLLTNLFYRDQKAPIVSGVDFPAMVSDLPKIVEQIMPLIGKFSSASALEDINVFIDFMHEQSDVRKDPLGIFGYCMGGALAIRAAARYPDEFCAVASFHAGGLVSEDADSPEKLLPKIRAALYVGHADQDPHMTAEQIQSFDHSLSQMNSPHEVELYSGAHHHFTMKDLPAYDKAASEKHWVKLLALLEKYCR